MAVTPLAIIPLIQLATVPASKIRTFPAIEVPAGTTGLLFMFTLRAGSNQPQYIDGINANGNTGAVRLVGGRAAGGSSTVESWYLANPPTGTYDITVTYNAATSEDSLMLYCLAGTDPVDPIGAAVYGDNFAGADLIASVVLEGSGSFMAAAAAVYFNNGPLIDTPPGYIEDYNGDYGAFQGDAYFGHKLQAGEAGTVETFTGDWQNGGYYDATMLVEIKAGESAPPAQTVRPLGIPSSAGVGPVSVVLGALPAGQVIRPASIPSASSVGAVRARPEYLGAGDEHFDSVVFLSHLDGADGATTAIDTSNSAHSMTFEGSAALDADDPILGTASLRIQGSTDQIRVGGPVTSWQFGFDPFTIELTARWDGTTNFSSNNTYATLIAQGINGDPSWRLALATGFNGPEIRFTRWTGPSITINNNGLFSPVAGVPFKVAVDFDSEHVVRIYVNGARVVSGIVNTPFLASAADLTIGNAVGLSNSLPFMGWIDEVRITKGVARYASDEGYTPDSGPFPDEGPGGSPTTQIIRPVGLASLASVGVPAFRPGTVTIRPSSAAGAAAAGAIRAVPGPVALRLAPIASSEAVGKVRTVSGPVILRPDSVLSAEAVGAIRAVPGPVIVRPVSIAPTGGVGAIEIRQGILVIRPSSIPSAAGVGAISVSPGPVTVRPAAIASASDLGPVRIVPGPVAIRPSGAVSDGAVGAVRVIARFGIALDVDPAVLDLAGLAPAIGAGAVLTAGSGDVIFVGSAPEMRRGLVLGAGPAILDILGQDVVVTVTALDRFGGLITVTKRVRDIDAALRKRIISVSPRVRIVAASGRIRSISVPDLG